MTEDILVKVCMTGLRIRESAKMADHWSVGRGDARQTMDRVLKLIVTPEGRIPKDRGNKRIINV